MNAFSIFGRMSLDDSDYQRGLRSAEGETKKAAGRMAQDWKKVGEAAELVGKTLSVALTAPIVAFGALAIRTAGDFEAAMNKVRGITQATGDDFQRLEALAKDLGASTQFSASQAADAMGFLAMAGFNVEDIISSLPGVLELAAAGSLDLARAADIASNVLTGFGLEATEIGRVNDVLAFTSIRANTSVEQLGEAFKFVAPVAAGLGVPLEEAAAAIAFMSDAGIQASMAGTSLRGILSEVSVSFDDLGIAANDSAGNMLPLNEIIAQLEQQGFSTSEAMTEFGLRAGPALQTLLSRGGSALRDLADDITNSAGTAARLAATNMEGFNGALANLRSAIEALQIAIAQSGLLPFFQGLIERLTGVIRYLSTLNPQLLQAITIFAGVAAAVGPVLLVFGTLLLQIPKITAALAVLRTTILAFSGPLGWFALAATGVGFLIAKLVGRDSFSASVDTAVQKSKELGRQIGDVNDQASLISAVGKLADFVGPEGSPARIAFVNLANEIIATSETAELAFERMRVAAMNMANATEIATLQTQLNLWRQQRDAQEAILQTVGASTDKLQEQLDALLAQYADVEVVPPHIITQMQVLREAVETNGKSLEGMGRSAARARADVDNLNGLIRLAEGQLSTLRGQTDATADSTERLSHTAASTLTPALSGAGGAADGATEEFNLLTIAGVNAAIAALETKQALAATEEQRLDFQQQIEELQRLREEFLKPITPVAIMRPTIGVEILKTAAEQALIASEANLRFIDTQYRLGEVTSRDVVGALRTVENDLLTLIASTDEGSDAWLLYSGQLASIRDRLKDFAGEAGKVRAPIAAFTDAAGETVAMVERTEGRIESLGDAFRKFASAGVVLSGEALDILTARFEANRLQALGAAEAGLRFEETQLALGQTTNTTVVQALRNVENELLALIGFTTVGSDEWLAYNDRLIAVRGRLKEFASEAGVARAPIAAFHDAIGETFAMVQRTEGQFTSVNQALLTLGRLGIPVTADMLQHLEERFDRANVAARKSEDDALKLADAQVALTQAMFRLGQATEDDVTAALLNQQAALEALMAKVDPLSAEYATLANRLADVNAQFPTAEELMLQAADRAVELAVAQKALGQATEDDVNSALVNQAKALQSLMDTLDSTDDAWLSAAQRLGSLYDGLRSNETALLDQMSRVQENSLEYAELAAQLERVRALMNELGLVPGAPASGITEVAKGIVTGVEAVKRVIEVLGPALGTFNGNLGTLGVAVLEVANKFPLFGSALEGYSITLDEYGQIIDSSFDPVKAVTAVFLELLNKSESFQKLLGMVNERLAPLAERIIEPLVNVLTILIDALWPLIEVVVNVIELAMQPMVWIWTNVLGPLLTGLANTIRNVWNAFANVIPGMKRIKEPSKTEKQTGPRVVAVGETETEYAGLTMRMDTIAGQEQMLQAAREFERTARTQRERDLIRAEIERRQNTIALFRGAQDPNTIIPPQPPTPAPIGSIEALRAEAAALNAERARTTDAVRLAEINNRLLDINLEVRRLETIGVPVTEPIERPTDRPGDTPTPTAPKPPAGTIAALEEERRALQDQLRVASESEIPELNTRIAALSEEITRLQRLGLGQDAVKEFESVLDRATFGNTPQAVQLAVATPLVEASYRMLDAADVMNRVFGSMMPGGETGFGALPPFTNAIERMTPVLERLLEEGVSVMMGQRSDSGPLGSPTAFLRGA